MNNNSAKQANITSFIALAVALLTGFFSIISTCQTTKVEKQKAYAEYLQHKMNKLEDVQKLFELPVEDDDIYAALDKYTRYISNKTEFVLTTYSCLFSHYENKYKELVEKNNSNTEVYSGLMLQQSTLKVELISGKETPKVPPIVKSILKTASEVQSLISDELAATYADFEKLTK